MGLGISFLASSCILSLDTGGLRPNVNPLTHPQGHKGELLPWKHSCNQHLFTLLHCTSREVWEVAEKSKPPSETGGLGSDPGFLLLGQWPLLSMPQSPLWEDAGSRLPVERVGGFSPSRGPLRGRHSERAQCQGGKHPRPATACLSEARFPECFIFW